MARPKAQLRLGAFFNPTGHHVASWRHPQRAGRRRRQFPALRRDRADRRARQVRHDLPRRQRRRARSAHGGAVALGAVHRQLRADHADLGARRRDEPHRPRSAPRPRATTSRFTSRASSPRSTTSAAAAPAGTWSPPAQSVEAYNFGRDAHYGHAERYERANEFAEVVVGAVGQLGRRRLHARQGERAVLRSGEDACAQSRGQALQGARARSTSRARRRAIR